ncbi:L-ribulose-5-phosphate 3-epimerase [Jeongeupia sp. USM3]|uniref:L-ribulose-5-phosphate 3-epimerase n=1 Tax=Jeongeupia sp. USM3 TaxID=1906741 RepID=UPI00089DE765|nr:L-ribulose-5-phosphate 3-epimerase [Jeongeupia sp. USM3]AOY01108.1 xylulose 5-phosphate 3-epimerase [Jeongeupia sp. USM3]
MAGIRLGIYEKALPLGCGWPERLAQARALGFDFVEISIDEKDERLARLDWNVAERRDFANAVLESGIRVPSMCFSGHRRFPLGSEDDAVRATALGLMKKAVDFAADTGIRTIQLAGYDEYYHEGNARTRARFREGLEQAVAWAAEAQVMLAMEIMDTPLMNSISKALGYAEALDSPWFQLYPDLGNLSAWDNDVELELRAGHGRIAAVHVKDTLPGRFKNVPFGDGVTDFVACFGTLWRTGYRGAYLIEMWSGEHAADPLAECRAARDWVLGKMREAGLPVDA